MKKAALLLAGLSMAFLNLRAQNEVPAAFQSYTQKIPGSEISFKMIAVAGGHFQMGSPEGEKGRHPDEGPQTEVSVDSFWIEEHEVTFDEFVLFQNRSLDNEPIPDAITRPSPPYIDFSLGMGSEGGYPANSMSQHAALMYCKWLYEKTGTFYRLPTEAEWEYACRAGSKTAFYFGPDSAALSKYAWYAANSEGKYHRVKQRAPNDWGLYDMLGNLAEWTLDQYDASYFKTVASRTNNPHVPLSKKYPVTLKGGHFRENASSLRSAARLPSDKQWNARDPQIPKSKWWIADAPFIGFRIVRPARQPAATEIQKFFDHVLQQSQ